MKRFTTGILCLTRSCNLDCRYCVVPTIPTIDVNELTVLSSLDILHRYCDFIVILGGEPTLSPHLDAVVGKLNDIGAHFTMVTNGVRLRNNPLYRQHLVDIGLRSITISYDSYKSLSISEVSNLLRSFDDVSVNIIYDSKMVGKLYDLIVDLTTLGAWSVVTAYIYFDDDRQHWYFSNVCHQHIIDLTTQPNVGDEMTSILQRYDRLKIHNSKEYFSSMMDHAFDMSWHCQKWNVLFVNNDMRIQFCQDLPASDFTIFDLDTKIGEMERSWYIDVSRCRGCYINCYFDAEHVGAHHRAHDGVS